MITKKTAAATPAVNSAAAAVPTKSQRADRFAGGAALAVVIAVWLWLSFVSFPSLGIGDFVGCVAGSWAEDPTRTVWHSGLVVPASASDLR